MNKQTETVKNWLHSQPPLKCDSIELFIREIQNQIFDQCSDIQALLISHSLDKVYWEILFLEECKRWEKAKAEIIDGDYEKIPF